MIPAHGQGTLLTTDFYNWADRQPTRNLYIYLPHGYDATSTRFPVIYAQDGQNLFASPGSSSQTWRFQEAMDQLQAEGLAAIIVGVSHSAQDRLAEYSPFGTDGSSPTWHNAYVRYLQESVKPYVDSHYRTLPGRETTGILGSSMGGLISLCAFFQAAETFGLAGAMSNWMWIGEKVTPDKIMSLISGAGSPAGRILLDIGDSEHVDKQITEKEVSAEVVVSDTRRLRDLLVSKGYELNRDLCYNEIKSGRHSERDWARRLPECLRFLLAGVCSRTGQDEVQ